MVWKFQYVLPEYSGEKHQSFWQNLFFKISGENNIHNIPWNFKEGDPLKLFPALIWIKLAITFIEFISKINVCNIAVV